MKVLKLIPFLFLGVFACQTPQDIDPNDPNAEQPASEKGTPTEVGQPVGAAFSQTIGPEGGSISTPDNKITFTFPAGAVSKPTPITIQPVENKAFVGIGLTYNITAPDTKLNKNAEMTLHYTPEDVEGAAPEVLGIAHQDQEGIWQSRVDVKVDKVNKTVKAPVSHLAHWAFYEQFFIECDKKEVASVEQVKFVVKFPERRTDAKPGDPYGDLMPLSPHQIISASRVVRRTINGVTDGSKEGDNYANVGQITEDRSLAKATYTAPAREPDNNPVAIGAEIDLKQLGHIILVKNVRVESGANLSINGSYDANPNVMLTVNGNKLQGAITDSTGLKMISFSIEGFHGDGVYGFGPNGGSQIIARISQFTIGTHGYYNDRAEWISGKATVTISNYKGKERPMIGKISGTFFRGTSPFSASAKFKAVPAVL
ncbi:hypothetical protein [Runella sp.]|uniref:hypothetical protein n=1 Tax=Runella sp. TaxID=1960881 RepID=UPI003D0AB8B0